MTIRLHVSSTTDFCHAERDDVSYDVVRERLIDSEPDRALGQFVSREPVAYLIDDPCTEREDAQMTLRGRETEQRFSLVLERRHSVAGALLGVGRDLQRQGPDVFECCPSVGVQALEVVVNYCHAANNKQPSIVRECEGGARRVSAGHGRLSVCPRLTLPVLTGPVRPAPRSTSGVGTLSRCSTEWLRATTWPTMCFRWARIGPGAGRWCRPSTPRPGQLILDVAAGTGTSSEPFAQRGAIVIPTDLSFGMLLVGKQRRPDLSFVAADALQLPYADASFDAVTISFGLRNVEDTAAALSEMRRVIRPGGMLVVCEFSTPTWRPFRTLYSNYLVAALPRIASLVSSNPAAYEYLAESIQAWPNQEGLATMIEKSGWRDVEWRNLSGGIVALHRASS